MFQTLKITKSTKLKFQEHKEQKDQSIEVLSDNIGPHSRTKPNEKSVKTFKLEKSIIYFALLLISFITILFFLIIKWSDSLNQRGSTFFAVHSDICNFNNVIVDSTYINSISTNISPNSDGFELKISFVNRICG